MARRPQAAEEATDITPDQDQLDDAAAAAAEESAEPATEDAPVDVITDTGPTAPYVVVSEFTASVGGTHCTFKPGQILDPLAGANLALAGAPVLPVEQPEADEPQD